MGAKEWFEDTLQKSKDMLLKGVQVASEGAEDVGELWELEDDFSTLSQSRESLSKHQEELDAIDGMDAFMKPESVEAQIATANASVRAALGAALEIQKTKLRFSQDYLGESVEGIDKGLDDLNGVSAGLLSDIVDPSTLKGMAAKALLSDEKRGKLASLSLKLKELEANTQGLKRALESLIDPKLKTPSNNSILNPYLNAKGAVDRIQHIAETLQKMKQLKDRADTFLGRK